MYAIYHIPNSSSSPDICSQGSTSTTSTTTCTTATTTTTSTLCITTTITQIVVFPWLLKP